MKKVLIADDTESSREILRTVLESVGYAVTEAANGLEALERARQERPDLIILDLHMPRMDGFIAVRQLRADPDFAGIPVIALTASAMHGDHEQAIAAGFTGYLTKPIRPTVLRREVQRLLQG